MEWTQQRGVVVSAIILLYTVVMVTAMLFRQMDITWNGYNGIGYHCITDIVIDHEIVNIIINRQYD